MDRSRENLSHEGVKGMKRAKEEHSAFLTVEGKLKKHGLHVKGLVG